MNFTPTPVATAAALLALSLSAPVLAQGTAPAGGAAQTVEVTGIRAALQRSIEVKRDAPTNIEVVTAEDVGKMPDKNIADALSRLGGVNVQFGGALAMDEAERIAIRGTSPNLNLTTVAGHALSSGDWHVGDQGSSGRSVGFGLMPSSLIGQARVYKTTQADITEGGIAGTVDIIPRKPMDFRARFTGQAELGFVHADLPGNTDPQLRGLLNWKSEDNKLGVLVQAFKEDRHLRRDGQETFSFGVISAAQATASGNANLANKRMPGSLNSALFEGVRQRVGGYLGVQVKPSRDVELHISGFYSQLTANNYNSSAFALPTALVNNGWRIQDATIEGDVITAATLVRPATAPATQRVIGLQFDHNLREGAKSISSFFDVEGKVKVSEQLAFKGRAGYTAGSGKTNSQPSLTFGVINPNMRYQINTTRPTDYSVFDAANNPIDLSRTSSYSQMSNTGASVNSEDRESYLHLDGEYKMPRGFLSSIKFGARTATHVRSYDVIGARWNAQDNANGTPVSPSPFISVTGGLLVTNIVPTAQIPVPATSYGAGFASGINANFPRALFRFDPSQLQAFTNQYVNWDPVAAKVWSSGYRVEEANNSVYLMGEFEADKLTGNVGVRLVQTKVSSLSYQALPNGTGAGQCVPLAPCSVPNAIVGSRFATYLPQLVETDHTVALPSLNLRYALRRDLIGRFSVSQSLGRPNYNELAGAVSLNNTLLTGSSGNPNLKPITSTNLDAQLAWYFSRRGFVQGGVFQYDMKDYVKAGTSQVEFFNTATGQNAIYTVTSRYGVSAKLKGAELGGEFPIGAGFGIGANALLLDGKDQDGVELLGTSKRTYNLVAFYEDDKLSVRVAWNERSDYPIGFVGNGTNTLNNGVHKYKGSGTLSASLNYRINSTFTLTLDGNNLNNPVRSTYFISENAPGYWHQSGRQYFLTLRARI